MKFLIEHRNWICDRLSLLFLSIFFFTSVTNAQEDTLKDNAKLKIIYDRDRLVKTELYLKAWQKILELKTYIDYRNLPELEYCDVKMESDSFRITLKSGLSWDMEEGPPEEPKWFFFKMLSKKGRNTQEVADRIKYLEFITKCEEVDGLAFEMIEKVDMYNTFFNEDSKPCLQLKYEFIPSENRRFEQINREIKVYGAIPEGSPD